MVQRLKTRRELWFCVAFVVLLLACWLTPDHDIDGKAVVNIWERTSFYLTRVVFNVLCAVSVLLLLVPAVRNILRGTKDRSVWWAPVAVLAHAIVENAGKKISHLPRPDGSLTGFPSGHAMASFLMAWLIATKYPKLAPLWYALAVAISWSRIEVHAHFPYQIVAGAIFGTLIGWSISYFLRDRLQDAPYSAEVAANA